MSWRLAPEASIRAVTQMEFFPKCLAPVLAIYAWHVHGPPPLREIGGSVESVEGLLRTSPLGLEPDGYSRGNGDVGEQSKERDGQLLSAGTRAFCWQFEGQRGVVPGGAGLFLRPLAPICSSTTPSQAMHNPPPGAPDGGRKGWAGRSCESGITNNHPCRCLSHAFPISSAGAVGPSTLFSRHDSCAVRCTACGQCTVPTYGALAQHLTGPKRVWFGATSLN